MKRNVIIVCLVTLSSLAYSQVGINTVNPQGVLHVDGAKDNATTGAPTAAQQLNDFTVTPTGNVGVGTTTPTSKLEVNSGTANTSGLKLTNLTSATPVSTGASLGVDATGNVVTVVGGGNTIIPGSFDVLLAGQISPFVANNTFRVLDLSLGSGNVASWRINSTTLQVPPGKGGLYLLTYTSGPVWPSVPVVTTAATTYLSSFFINNVQQQTAGIGFPNNSYSASLKMTFPVTLSMPVTLADGDQISFQALINVLGGGTNPQGFRLYSVSLQKLN